MRKIESRGHCSIGLFQPKYDSNIGGAYRAAFCYGADLIVVKGRRHKRYIQDTTKAYKHIPTLHTQEDIFDLVPYGAVPVAIELADKAKSLVKYTHHIRAFYIFGPEDGSLSNDIIKRCRDTVYVPTTTCMNLAATVNVVLYDRLSKLGR